MAKLSPFEDRRRQVMLNAAKRWTDHSAELAASLNTLDPSAKGIADSATRQAQFDKREELFRQAAALRAHGRLPPGLERKIGPTLDFLENAPSDAARNAGKPVARIVSSCDPTVQADGFATAFRIAPRLLLTNWHVFPDRTAAVGRGANFFHERHDAGIAIGRTFELDPDYFFLANERLDFCIVGTKGTAVDAQPEDADLIGLSDSPAKILLGQPINIVQHPDGGPKVWSVQDNRLVALLEEGFLQYTTDTMGGSSGSPVFSSAWELVGLHHSGVPEVHKGKIIADDGSVWTEDMGDDHIHWIANEGIRVSAIVRAISEARLDDARMQSILAALISNSADPAVEISRLEGGPATPIDLPSSIAGIDAGRHQFIFTGPVTINIGADATDEVGVEERSLRFDPDYAARKGFDREFLGEGLIVDPPSVADGRKAELLMDGSDVLVLPYHHYSLAMNAKRRLTMWTAANIDFSKERRLGGGRSSFGSDRWAYDPRIPREAQLGAAEFYDPAHQSDKGHVVRRQDSAWGDTLEEVEFANSDTFHWTNCTPQHAAFNRAVPPSRYGLDIGLWGGFENYVEAQLKQGDTRACILAGPVLADDDPVVDVGKGPIAIPIRFWKIVAVIDREASKPKLAVHGFMLDQKGLIDRFGIEFAPGRFAKNRLPVADIEAAAGLTFAKALHDHDVLR